MKRKITVLFLSRKKVGAGMILLALIFLMFFCKWPYNHLAVTQRKVPAQATLVIDPGHGGIDGGVSRGELLEKDITLGIAKLLKRALEKKGYNIKMTRETDRDVSHLIPGGPETRYRRDVHSRTKFVNESGADLFVSIHVDACEDPSIRGAIVFHSKDNAESKALATIIQNHLNKVTETDPQSGEYFHKGIKEGDFHILNNSTIPGALVEVGFITNAGDRKLLSTLSHRKKLAQAICNGIIEYLLDPLADNGFQDLPGLPQNDK
ncbi:MAG: N-acetylmuramoyl-L-alanine amidase [Firmicutes bacterium]|nr:N-acetylmuramoyl-L-alanine amidase [Bacillota bacterium]